MAHFSFINDLILTLLPGVAILFPKKIFDKWWDRIWGGNSVNWYYNWLRDDNEGVLLMGSLAEAFYYLQDDDQGQKYTQQFNQEITELNDEDNKRNASGGNVQVNLNQIKKVV